MWEILKIEQATERKLKKEFGDAEGGVQFSTYVIARKAIIEDILPNIRRLLPDHTDHDAPHIANVMRNLWNLLDYDIPKEYQLNAMEFYCLITSALFHDAGNIFGRKDHQKKISQIYDYAVPEARRDKQVKLVVLKATEAHTGEAPDGTKDTMKHLSKTLSVKDHQVKLQELAALVRFADELAEGRQRTSLFMQMHHMYPPTSELHHKYAAITSVGIDMKNERITLTYNIDVGAKTKGAFDTAAEAEIRELLNYTYIRIDKMNQERKYARHYSPILAPLKQMTVTFNFWVIGQVEYLQLPKDLVLTDLVVPGDAQKGFVEHFSAYIVDNVISQIRNVLP
jgi:hypothetical protein